MTAEGTSITVRAALHDYFEENDFGTDGGCCETWFTPDNNLMGDDNPKLFPNLD